GRRRRHRAARAQLSRPAGRRAGRAPVEDEGVLPYLQRLHDGPAQRPRLRLLSAGPVLRQTPARRPAESAEEGGRVTGRGRGCFRPGRTDVRPRRDRGRTMRHQTHVAATAFLALFSIVGFALYGLPFFYDFFVQDLGWTRQQVTSGNAYSKLHVGPLFGFAAGWFIDRFGPRRLMLAGILMGGGALIGLGWATTLTVFYVCYLFNALGYVCGGPLPNQVLLSRWFDRNRGKAKIGR